MKFTTNLPKYARGATFVWCAISALSVSIPAKLLAQVPTRPALPWRTIETQWFRFHTPAEYEGWTRDVAQRMDSVRERVRLVVGHAPSGKVDIVVEDPANATNGSAWALSQAPTIVLYPVPPTPRSFIGNNRTWGEILTVHEFAHIAHLTRPSRNTLAQLRQRLPIGAGPLVLSTPRWLTEGYATYVEGVLTGSGRPHAPLRAAVLREWALAGALPTYDAMSDTQGFLGGTFAYLQGAAFVDWLAATEGDSSLTALWRRQSARTVRSFASAFAGVYGEEPPRLYQRFVADQIVEARAQTAKLEAAGVVRGELVQRLTAATGDPAVAPDGQQLAVVVRSELEPARLVIWRNGAAAVADTVVDSARVRQVRRMLKRDPEDVAPVLREPLPRRALYTLDAMGARSHEDPRWFRDGKRLLVVRQEPRADGTLRPELFEWTPEKHRLRAVTKGASVRRADPSPDGTQAAAIRCEGGRCDLVRVTLASGAVREMVPSSPARQWDRPRWSPDGKEVAAVVHRDARWRVAIVNAETGTFREVSPDDGAERYDVTYTPDGQSLLYVSEHGGIPNVVRLDLATGIETSLTRVTGAAFAPEPVTIDTSVYFLHLTPEGFDLRRVVPARTPVRGAVVAIESPAAVRAQRAGDAVAASLAPRGPTAVDSFPRAPLRGDRAYGLGPRSYRLLPGFIGGPDGRMLGGYLTSTDPAARFTWLLHGVLPAQRQWYGGSLRAAWRGWPVTVTGEAFSTAQDLGHESTAAPARVVSGLDGRLQWSGGAVVVEQRRTIAASHVARTLHIPMARVDVSTRWRAGAAGGRMRFAGDSLSLTDARRNEVGQRVMGFGEFQAGLQAQRGARVASLRLDAHGAAGRTLEQRWTRARAGMTVASLQKGSGIRLNGVIGRTSSDAPLMEQFAMGGQSLFVFDPGLMSQRVAVEALPSGTALGTHMSVVRASVPLQGVEGYFLGWQAGNSWGGRLSRVAGVEARSTTAVASILRIPGSTAVAGVGRQLDGALKGKTTWYVSVQFAP
ncbi:MAG: hypothetical protein HEQ38_07750 [Gemmatimonas sp.]|nr:hypothetical protein [Gemmatimonas sp.]